MVAYPVLSTLIAKYKDLGSGPTFEGEASQAINQCSPPPFQFLSVLPSLRLKESQGCKSKIKMKVNENLNIPGQKTCFF